MKINIVLNRLPGVSETFLVNWIQQLCMNNVQVRLILVESNQYIGFQNIQYLDNSKIVTRFNLLLWLKSILLFCYFLNFKLGFRYAHLTMGSPDIIHFSYSALAVNRIDVLLKIKNNYKIRTIVSCRGTSENVKPFISVKRANLLKELFVVIDYVHCVSDNLKQSMIQNFGLLHEKVFTNRPAINIERFPFQEKTSFHKNKKVKILSIGRLNYIKGYYFAIEAMQNLKIMGVDFEYNIIGDGQLKEELLFHRHHFNLNEEIKFLGVKVGDEIITELSNADILLLPSLSEGIANVALEAMAMGVFVISSNVGGMSEVITNEKTGLLVNAYSSAEIINAIIWIKDNPEKCLPILNEARQLIQNEFSTESQVSVFLSEYKKLLGYV